MPGTTFKLDIVTPERMLLSITDAVSLVVPAADGYLGVLTDHAPLLAELIPGEIHVERATAVEEMLAISGGFLEVTSEAATILADTAERPDEIDIDRARLAYRRAADRLSSIPQGLDVDRASAALARAAARLRVAGQSIG